MAVVAGAGRRILHRPIDLRRVVASSGAQAIEERSKGHVAYFFGREIERWSEERSVPWLGRFPTHHANDIALPNCVLIAGLKQGLDIDCLAHAMLEAHWLHDADLADRGTLAVICRSVGVAPEPILEAANLADVRSAYERNTEEAIQRSVFGSPTYFVDGDMFYGQDRLEMVERALKRPYAGSPALPRIV